eukprot:4813575-Amphidinium_carterae.1
MSDKKHSTFSIGPSNLVPTSGQNVTKPNSLLFLCVLSAPCSYPLASAGSIVDKPKSQLLLTLTAVPAALCGRCLRWVPAGAVPGRATKARERSCCA